MIWDYVFVGGGPSTLMAATTIAQHRSAKLLIVDAGNDLKLRGCPGLSKARCTYCETDHCRVTMGIGGASAGFGNKLCYFPASSEIESLVPSDELSDVHNTVGQLLGVIGLRCPPKDDVVVAHRGRAGKKFYESHALLRNDYRHIVDTLISRLTRDVHIQSKTEIVEFARTPHGNLLLRTKSGDKIETRNVILAMGRSGHNSSREAFRSLGIPFNEGSVDVGFRIEADTNSYSDEFLYQHDPKFKFRHGELGTSRTFCACQGGVIVPVKFAQSYFADGAFSNVLTGRTNVALMVRAKSSLTSEQVDSWCTSINRASANGLLLGESQIGDTSALEDAEGLLQFFPTWPTADHRAMMKELLGYIIGGKFVKMFRPSKTHSIRIYGPSVDLYWPTPTLLQGFKTNVPGVSIIGDATGYSRGIFQALVSGAGWALTEAQAENCQQEQRALGV